ncbi:MAG TPA: hypothetical protein VF544_17825 [Pyrinomonadaceae bacterium]|jgi:FtsZ-binding cell division protein ZapB
MGAITDLLKEIPLSAVLREKLTTLEADIAALQTENAILKDDNRQLQAENKRLQDQIKSLTHKDDLDEIAVQALTFLAKREGHLVKDSALAAALKMKTTQARYYAGQLEEQGYISAQHHSGILSLYTLTQKGRRYAIENNLI